MCDGDVLSSDLLEMKLHDVSDLLLERMCQEESDIVKCELLGNDISNGERMKLVIFLCKNEVNENGESE